MEVTKDDYVYAILKNGEYIRKKTLQEVSFIPHVEYYVIARYDRTFNGPSNTTRWYQYFVVDVNGNLKNIKLHDFEVIYIDTDDGCTNFFGRNVQIYDLRKDKIYKYKSMTLGVDFIKKEIVPLLETLHEYGSWEAYSQSLELKNLQEKYEKLKKDYCSLEEKYDNIAHDSE